MNTRIATLLTLALAAMAFAQTPTPHGIRRLPPRSAPATHTAAAQTNEPVQRVSPSRQLPVPRRASQSFIAPTAKSDDLVESPATNVVKGAFGYTLGAIWDGKIPEEAEPDKNGEVSVPVEAKKPFEPFSSVTLSISTNDSRIACIAAETPRMALAESYAETLGKIDEIVRKIAKELNVCDFPHSVTTNDYAIYPRRDAMGPYYASPVIAGKLYREFLKDHPNDSDYALFKNIVMQYILKYSPRLIAGSRYNELLVLDKSTRRVLGIPRPPPANLQPDYLQQIWQPLVLSADYYPYAGDAVIRFSVRDVEARTEHTNLVSVAQLKAEREKTAEEAANQPASRPMILPGIVRRGPAQTTLSPEEQAFKDSLYRLSFAEAVEKAKNNDPEALLRIALAYIDGKDVREDTNKAREYIEKASSQNYGYAQFILGLMESVGDGVLSEETSRIFNRCQKYGLNTSVAFLKRKPSVATAVICFEQAVSNGVSFAQSDLEYVRKRLKEKQESDELKRQNEELLRGD